MTEYGRCPAFGYECEYVAKVEAQAAEIERLRAMHSAVEAELTANERMVDNLYGALEDVMDILSRAESNASGNPEWDYVGPRVAAARAAIAALAGKAEQ